MSMMQYMKNTTIETISEMTDENLVKYFYTMLMETVSSSKEKITEMQQVDS